MSALVRDALIHVANAMLLLSLSVRNMVVLRAFNLLASALFIAYFAALAEPLWGALAWNVVFASVNVWRISRIVAERRAPRLSAEEQRLYHACFEELPPHGFKRLLELGEWHDGAPPLRLEQGGRTPERLWVVASGRLELQGATGEARTIAPGEFLGDGAFFSGEPLARDVLVAEPARCMGWSVARLRRFMEDEPAYGAALQRILGRSLVRRLALVGAPAVEAAPREGA